MAADPLSAAPDEEVARYVDDFLEAQLAPRTREAYAGDLAIFLSWCERRRLHPLSAARPDIDRFRNWLGQPIGPDGKPALNGRPRYADATIARKLSAVRAFYTYLAERHVLPGSPAVGVKGPKISRAPRGRAITQDQIRTLLTAAAERDAQTEAIVCLLMLNGLRVSEVCRANIEDLRREAGGGHSLIVRGKGNKQSAVALNSRTERAVLTTVGGRTQGPILRRQDGRRVRAGTPAPRVAFNRQAIYRLLGELADAAGLVGDEDGQVDNVHPHRLRHTFVTTLLDLGVPLQAVQDAARHSSPDTTRQYDRARDSFREHPTHKLSF